MIIFTPGPWSHHKVRKDKNWDRRTSYDLGHTEENNPPQDVVHKTISLQWCHITMLWNRDIYSWTVNYKLWANSEYSWWYYRQLFFPSVFKLSNGNNNYSDFLAKGVCCYLYHCKVQSSPVLILAWVICVQSIAEQLKTVTDESKHYKEQIW
jgi:hypothetical protein